MIAVDWGSLEETFIIWRIENDWSLIDFQVAHFITSKMMSIKAHPVDVIIDVRTADSQPQLAHAMIRLHRKDLPKNLNKIIVLQGNDTWQRSIKLIENFYPEITKAFIFTSSVDEAYAHVLAVA